MGVTMRVLKESFGETMDGEKVDAFILKNRQDVTVTVLNYGATIQSIVTPDREGNLADIVLGFDDMTGYQSDENPYFGACCGRYANRIAAGRFALNGTNYLLAINNGENALHGGLVGFDKKVWTAQIVDDQSVRMTLKSPDGEEGYPGNLTIEILYQLNEENEFSIQYTAITDQATVINLTNHSYFNLAGTGTALDHLVQINADRYTVVDEGSIPTGELRDVVETEMDFRGPKRIGDEIDQTSTGYDHNYCLNFFPEDQLIFAAAAQDPASGRTLKCSTTEPGVQFYTGNFIGEVQGKNGAIYKDRDAFCFETQHYPDSPNRPEFPSTELAPNDTYKQTTIYTFGAK